MATRSSSISSFNLIGTLSKIFYVSAALVLLIIPIAIQSPQNIKQEASIRNPLYSISIANVNPSLIFGKEVSFQVVGKNIDAGEMWFLNTCSQNGNVVYRQHLKIPTTGLVGPFTLGPTTSWTGGGADCIGTVELFQKGTFKLQDSLSYTVGP